MSTQPTPMPEDVPTLQNALKSSVAHLMAHSQTIQELTRANMNLRAALHLAQANNEELNTALSNFLKPVQAAPADNGAVMDHCVENADSVSA